jgi:hypothetical protein
MSTMSGDTDPYSQRRTVASIRSHSAVSGSASVGGVELSRWSPRAYWETATATKLRHLVKLEALRSRVTGTRALMPWIAVAYAHRAAWGWGSAPSVVKRNGTFI